MSAPRSKRRNVCPLTRQHPVADIFSHAIAKCLSACGLRNVVLEVWARKYFIDDVLIHLAPRAHGTVSVVFLVSMCKVANSGVDEDITRT